MGWRIVFEYLVTRFTVSGGTLTASVQHDSPASHCWFWSLTAQLLAYIDFIFWFYLLTQICFAHRSLNLILQMSFKVQLKDVITKMIHMYFILLVLIFTPKENPCIFIPIIWLYHSHIPLTKLNDTILLYFILQWHLFGVSKQLFCNTPTTRKLLFRHNNWRRTSQMLFCFTV